jgi:hypothetical protein
MIEIIIDIVVGIVYIKAGTLFNNSVDTNVMII